MGSFWTKLRPQQKNRDKAVPLAGTGTAFPQGIVPVVFSRLTRGDVLRFRIAFVLTPLKTRK